MAVDLSKLEKSFKDIQKKYGNKEVNTTISRIPSISPNLNYVLGGGWAKNRIHEIFGWEAVGKTQLLTLACIDVQRAGGFPVIIDSELTFDMNYAMAQGLDVSEKRFRVYQPKSIEEGFDLGTQLSESGVDLLGFDSVSTLTPNSVVESEYGAANMGAHARAMSQGLAKFSFTLNENKTTCIFTNQFREKMVLMGDNRTTSGGNGLKFYASIRLEIAKIKPSDAEKKRLYNTAGEPLGGIMRVKGIKNKTAPYGRVRDLVFYFDSGIDVDGEFIEHAVNFDMIEKGGAWYTLENGERFQGKVNLLEYLKGNDDVFTPLKEKVNKRMSLESSRRNNEEIQFEGEDESFICQESDQDCP